VCRVKQSSWRVFSFTGEKFQPPISLARANLSRKKSATFPGPRNWPGKSETGLALNWRPPRLQTQLRPRHGVQARLSLFGQAREDHRDVIAGMFVAGTGDDDPGALEPAVVARRLQRHGHFRPGVERRGAAKFDAVSVDHDGFGG